MNPTIINDQSSKQVVSPLIEPPPIPLHLITGFLGVGKTTSILHLLSGRRETDRMAVIVNEFGEISIDGPIISADGSPFAMAEVPGGCICCATMDLLIEQIESILNTVNPTRLIIEPSGLARPSEVLLKIKESPIGNRFTVKPVIGIVDPDLVADDSMRDSLVFEDQADTADLVFLNRIDLCKPESFQFACQFFNEMSPVKMKIGEGTHGQIPLEWLDIDFPSEYVFTPKHEHHHSRKINGIGWFWPQGTFDEELLERLITELLNAQKEIGLLRLKGIFMTASGPFLLEIAGSHYHRRQSEYRVENRVEILFDPAFRTSADYESLKHRFERAMIG